VNGFANSLSKLKVVPWDKVRQLLGYCPSLTSKPYRFGERELAAVTALGLFGLRTKLKQYGDEVLTYFLRVMDALPTATWVESLDSKERIRGPMAERFTHRLTLIALSLATLSKTVNKKVCTAVAAVLQKYSSFLANADTVDPVELSVNILPGICGCLWSLRATPFERVEKLRALFRTSFSSKSRLEISFDDFMKCRKHRLAAICEDHDPPDERDFLYDYDRKLSFSSEFARCLYEVVVRSLNVPLLRKLSQKVNQVKQEKELSVRYPYRSVHHFLQYAFLSALQQVLLAADLDDGLTKEIRQVAEDHLRMCARELSQIESHTNLGGWDHMYMVTKIMATLSSIYAHTSADEAEINDAYLRLSAMLSAFTTKPTVIITSFRIVCLDSLVVLVTKHPTLVGKVLRTMKEFIGSNLFLSLHAEAEESLTRRASVTSEVNINLHETDGVVVHRHEVFRELHDNVNKSLCLILEIGHKEDKECIPAFLSSIVHRLTKPSNLPDEFQFKKCAVGLLEAILIRLFHHPKAREVVLGYYNQQLFRGGTDLSLDKLMLESLGRIAAATGDQEPLNDIYSLMDASLGDQQVSYPHGVSSQEAIGPYGRGYGSLSVTVIDVLTCIALNMKDMDKLEEFVEKLISLLLKQGQSSFKAAQKAYGQSSFKATATSFNAGLLLEPLSQAFGRLPSLRNPNIRLYRDFWLYSFVLGLTTAHTVFPTEWQVQLRAIAAKSPTLLSDGAVNYFSLDLELSFVAEIGSTHPKVLQEIQHDIFQLIGRTPEIEKAVSQFTFVQCTFLKSLYHLEQMRLRMQPTTFANIFSYLEDKGLQKDQSVWVVLRVIVEKLLEEFISMMLTLSPGDERSKQLEQLGCTLAQKMVHVHEPVRIVASNSLLSLMSSFPTLYASSPIICCLLELMESCMRSISLLEMGKEPVRSPRLVQSIVQLESPAERSGALNTFASEVLKILQRAKEWNSTEIRSVLMDYLSGVGVNFSGFHDNPAIGASIEELMRGMDENATYKHFESTADIPGFIRRRSADVGADLQLRAHYLGEVRGMMMVRDMLAKTMDPFEKGDSPLALDMGRQLSMDIVTALKTDKMDKIVSAFFRATAYIISAKDLTEIHKELLYDVSVRPVKSLKDSAVLAAAHCWQWVLSAKRELSFELLTHIGGAWRWTIDSRVGFFSTWNVSDYVVNSKWKPALPAHLDIHRVLVEFLCSRIELAQSNSQREFDLIVDLLHLSLPLIPGPVEGHLISGHIAVVGLRFRLLQAALMAIKSGLIGDTIEYKLLLERFYATAFDYFCFDMMWPTQCERDLRSDISRLLNFWWELKSLSDSMTREAPGTVSAPLFWDSVPAETSVSSATWLNTITLTRKASSLSLGSGGSMSKMPRSASFQSKIGKEDKILSQINRKGILLHFLHHELERLLTWYNPSSLPQKKLKNEDILLNWTSPCTSERHWKVFVLKAYQQSPHLAVQLMERYPGNEMVAKEVTSLVKQHPLSFIGISRALMLFVTPETARDINAELIHILYWRQISPSIALKYLCPPYTHHLIANMASKTLKLVQTDDLLIIIPQLVQGLRHDDLGFIQGFIFWANQNPILTHQFLWNMQSNVYLDEEGTERDGAVADLLEDIIRETKDTLSGDYHDFLEREFTFFEDVTGISGKIRDYPKGPARKEACRKALREVSLVPGVYLPANPDSVIVEIDRDSGIPMQSAAKAPFLARFKVRPCGINEVVKMNKTNNRLLRQRSVEGSTSPLDHWQAYIFKVGDDVRQDMLALQIMGCMKDIIDSVGIPLYLKPYRVVATGTGRGVIECVPDTMSRDELGKKTSARLKSYFLTKYGHEDSPAFIKARSNFIRSMAGYSLVGYLLQFKDRHNGNILIDKNGYIVHIDFGFLFESSPGGNLGFEPHFKLTDEMLELMGGKTSDTYQWFNELFVQGYLALRPHMEEIVTLVQLMLESKLPCFRGQTIPLLRSRFNPNLSEKEASKAALNIVEQCCLNLRSYGYDWIQENQQGIFHATTSNSAD
jgi:phosphatidylinositol 4-kinase